VRGRHRQGRGAGGRGGLRLDRAREALHNRDDGPLPGDSASLASVRLLAQATATDAAAIGTTTARPPWTPSSSACWPGATTSR
jgi:hypothetical protein